MSNINKCKTCGKDASDHQNDDGSWYVECSVCKEAVGKIILDGPLIIRSSAFKEKDEAIDAWNGDMESSKSVG